MMNKRTLLILEVAWIVIGIICIAAAIHSRITDGGNRYLILVLMGVISFAMAFFRHIQRKKN